MVRLKSLHSLQIQRKSPPPSFYKPSSDIDTQLILHSLYLTNLPEKIQKTDLRLSLYTLFATYGPVLDVVAVRNNKMRGQAHVAFRDIQASTQAMRALQGFDFFGKEMVRINIPLHTRCGEH